MSSTLPGSFASECCPPACDQVKSIQVPGPAGNDGEDGSDGTNGQNAFTTFSIAFTLPAEGASAVATVANSDWIGMNQILYASKSDGSVVAYLQAVAIGGTTSVTLKNVEDTASAAYIPNSAPGSIFTVGSKLSPGGLQGPNSVLTGAAGGDLKGNFPNPKISLANNKGDSVWGNGTDAVTVPAGTNGHMLAYDSTDAEGVKSLAALPLTGGTNVSKSRIARLSATTGLPIPLASSKAQINDPGSVAAGEVGAIVLDASSGNVRGTDAVEFQVNRGAGADRVASGNQSFIGAGQNNIASSTGSAVVGGTANAASGLESFVGSGNSNLASNDKSAICGGDDNTASGIKSFVGGGLSNAAIGDYAVVCGGDDNTASADTVIGGGRSNDTNGQYSFIPGGGFAKTVLYGQFAHASGRFASSGDAQISEILMRIETVNATPIELVLGASNGCPIEVGKNYFFDIKLIAKRTDTSADAIYTSTGVIRNIAGTTTASAIVTTEVFDGATLPATPVVVSADDVNDTLDILVTGIAATTIRWLAVVRLLEIG